MKRAPLFLLGVLAGCHQETRGSSPRSPAEQVCDRTLRESRAHEWTQQLADGVGPRLAGSPGDARAVAWAQERMRALGLANVHTEPVTAPHWQRGVETAEVVAPVSQRLSLTALGGSVGTPPEGLVAEVVEFPSLEALHRAPADAARGKLVFVSQAMERSRDGEGYGKAVPIRYATAGEAAQRGAVGVLIRSVATSDARFPHTGSMRYPDGATRIPAAALAVPDALLLHRLLAAGQPVSVHLTLGCASLPDAATANVVGEVVGRERPDEVVLLGAHLDSWDLGTGALDDAAGVGVVLEAGRQLLASPPRRTVRILLFANEENGLAGARAYAATHAADLSRHLVAAEVDVGTARASGLRYRAGPAAAGAVREAWGPLATLGIASPEAGGECGADISPLRAAGVPCIELQQDVSTYFDFHHSANDTYDKIDPAALAQVSAALAAFAYGAAEGSGDFGRIPEDQRERPRR
jgi:carboxypeptidase Q